MSNYAATSQLIEAFDQSGASPPQGVLPDWATTFSLSHIYSGVGSAAEHRLFLPPALLKDRTSQPTSSAGVGLTGSLETEDWLTVSEAAAYLRVSTQTIYDACSVGGLRHFRLAGRRNIRLRRSDLNAWMSRFLAQNIAEAIHAR